MEFQGSYSDGGQSIDVTKNRVTIHSVTAEGTTQVHQYDLQDIVVKGIIEHGWIDPAEITAKGYDKMQVVIPTTGDVYEFRGDHVDTFCDQLITYLNTSSIDSF